MDIPFLRPALPSLRPLMPQIAEIERSRIFTNFGPVNTRFERELTAMIEAHGSLQQDGLPVVAADAAGGACLTVCNATLGLMLAIRMMIECRPARAGRPRFALMPAFTFAAAAHAADWCGLTPLFCDIDPHDWAASAAAEEALIAEYGDDIAVIVPYATFGNCIDLGRYAELSTRTGIPIVVDAASSLGSLDLRGRQFGAGAPFPIIYSMHATKPFGIGEGGVVYSADRSQIERLRRMSNFGFGEPRNAEMPGLNAKLGEISAMLALARLQDFEAEMQRQNDFAALYRSLLPGWHFQTVTGLRQAQQFMPVLLPAGVRMTRDEMVQHLQLDGIGVATYFSPHLGEQSYFTRIGQRGPLPVTDQISRRILALPLSHMMTPETFPVVCDTLRSLAEQSGNPLPPIRRIASTPPSPPWWESPAPIPPVAAIDPIGTVGAAP